MNRLGRLLVVTLSLAAITAVTGHFNARTTRAVDIEPVKVVNSASDPVPITGSVKASQSGAWSVGINGTPTVNVASAPPVNVNFPPSIGINGTVPVQNAPGLIGFTPLVVQDFENPARSAYQASCNAQGVAQATCTITTPTTKNIAIETVSASLTILGSSASPLLASLTTTAGGVQAAHFFVPSVIGSFGGDSSYAFNNDVRIYADPGSDITAFINIGTTAGLPTITWTISGHFVCKGFQQLC